MDLKIKIFAASCKYICQKSKEQNQVTQKKTRPAQNLWAIIPDWGTNTKTQINK